MSWGTPNKDRVGLIKTKDILIYSQSEYQIEKDKIAAEQERQRLAKLEKQRQAEAQRLANAKSSDYQAVCKQEFDYGKHAINSIYTPHYHRHSNMCGFTTG